MDKSSTRLLQKLSIVIPARDEEGCIGSTAQHPHLELELKKVPHEIEDQGNGQSLSLYRSLPLARKIFWPGGLSKVLMESLWLPIFPTTSTPGPTPLSTRCRWLPS